MRGIILAPINSDLTALRDLVGRGTPVALVDHPRGQEEMCAVAVDDVLGGRLVVQHLLALGHRRIAFLSGVVDPVTVERRHAGVRQALADAGLACEQALVEVRVPVHLTPLAQAAAEAVQRILAAQPRVTAVICVNDTAALGVLRGLEAAGVRVPADVSVVGYDDLQFAAHLSPALTTVTQPAYRLGYTAADLLLDEARDGHTHREIVFEPLLAVRSSTARPS